MREKSKKQLPLMNPTIDHPQARELECISRILDQEPTIVDLVHQDLCRGHALRETGAYGMSAEQVLRAAIVKQMFGFSYELLPFHLADSNSLRGSSAASALPTSVSRNPASQRTSSASLAATWEQINRILVAHGKQEEVEKGRQVRIDCTVVESNIHPPTDATLLFDSVRVLARILDFDWSTRSQGPVHRSLPSRQAAHAGRAVCKKRQSADGGLSRFAQAGRQNRGICHRGDPAGKAHGRP